jgi:hypothetical protein
LYAQHPAICGQVIKKKMHRVSAQIYLRATVQDGVSRIHPQLLFFAAKVQISTSESGPKWRFRTRKAAAIFSLNKDGGIFNGTMYIPFALSYKNALRIKHRDEIVF